MDVTTETFDVRSGRRCEMIDISREVGDIVRRSGVSEGYCLVFCPHTTAAITINENADPDVCHDILLTLAELFPQRRAGYRHDEGNSDAHVKSSLLGSSQQVIVKNGKLALGTWQGIYFCEFDGPRNRKVTAWVRQ